MSRLLAIAIAVILFGACSGPGPARPMPNAWDPDSGRLPGGLAAHGLGTRAGATLLDAAAGPLMGYLAALAPAGDASADEFRKATTEEDLDVVATILDEMIAGTPEDPAAWNNRALVHLALGDREAAERCFREAIGRALDYLPARENLDRLYFSAQ